MVSRPQSSPVLVMTPNSEPTSDTFTIKVTLGVQYGQEVIWPGDSKAQKFCEIAGTKTLTRRLVQQIKDLGYRVEVIPTQPKEL